MAAPMQVKSSGNFAKRMEDRKVAWSGKKIAAKLVVPPGNDWIYFNEVGTAGPYPIVPVNAHELSFPLGGETVRTKAVSHPGIKASRMITSVLPEIREEVANRLEAAFAQGAADNPTLLQSAVELAAEDAKILITASMAEKLPGSRTATDEYSAGKLGGRTAADVFEEIATVVDASE